MQQVADIAFMTDQQEDGHDRNRGHGKWIRHKQPGEKGRADCSGNGGEGGNAEDHGHDQPDGYNSEAEQPGHTQEHAQRRGDALAALEAEKNGIQVAEKGGDAHQGDARGRQAGIGGDEDGDQPLEDVPCQHHNGDFPAAEAQYISGAGVAGALGTGVGQGEEAAHDDGARQGAHQIGEQHQGDGQQHCIVMGIVV